MLILHFNMNKKNFLVISIIFFILLVSPSLSFAYTDTAQANFIPWSGYWWPTTQGGLATGIGYRGQPAPIQQYELLQNGFYPGAATNWELINHYDPNALPWAGLCYAWASAAVTENIDFKPCSYGNVIFRVGDKKGLITACHTGDVLELANGSLPEVFHQWLLHYIKDNDLAFVAELEPSEEFWSYPVYKYSMEITEELNSLNISCQIWFADDQVHPDFQGTIPLTEVYTYKLYLNGQGEITGGEWTGSSTYNHPGLLWRPVSRTSQNPYLDYTVIRRIAEFGDDALEAGNPETLVPGSYNLVLLNEDRFRIPCENGDTVVLTLEKLDDLPEGITLRILNPIGGSVSSAVVTGRKEISFLAPYSPCIISVSRGSYAGGGLYSLALDLKKSFEYLVPRIQKGGAWLGVGFTNAGDVAAEDVFVVGRKQDGGVLRTLAGPLTLQANEKKTFLLSDFPLTNYESLNFYSLKILSDSPLSVISLYGNSNRNLSCFNGSSEGSQIVIPEITELMNVANKVWWGICNQETMPAEVSLKLYSREGSFLEELIKTIPGNGLLNYSPSVTPFHRSGDGGWIMVEAMEGTRLTGYASWIKDSYEKGESLLALNRIGNQFFIPHVAYDSLWKTTLTLINLSEQENTVTLTLVAGEERYELSLAFNPFEKKSVDVRTLFPSVAPELFNQSSLLLESINEITGFYAFETASSLAYYPLMSEEDRYNELVVAHVASDAYWWTGVGIFNPGDEPVSLSIVPYDTQGVVM
ncbi:MAG: hypothetical protein V2A69_12650, partial [Pseudomonadota bacterium]